jgi:hypothetical protein
MKFLTLLTPRAGKWFIITKFKKEIRSVLYDPRDPNKKVPSAGLLVWPYGLADIKLTWTELVDSEETAKTAKVPKDPAQKKYKSYRKFYNSNMIIGTREEHVKYLNLMEVHPAVVEVTAKDGGSLEILVMITYEVTDPIKTRSLEDFLGYGANIVTEIIRDWCAKKEFHDIRAIETKDIKKDDSDIYSRIKEDNKKLFEPNGFRIENTAVIAVLVAERSKDLLESEEDIKKEENYAKVAEKTKNAEIALNVAQEARNEAEIKFQTALTDLRIKENKESAASIAEQNKAWVGGGLTHLYISGGEQLSSKNDMFEASAKAQTFGSEDRRKKPNIKRESDNSDKKEGGKK